MILCRRGSAETALHHLREIMGKLKLAVNEEKTRICKVPKGEAESTLPRQPRENRYLRLLCDEALALARRAASRERRVQLGVEPVALGTPMFARCGTKYLSDDAANDGRTDLCYLCASDAKREFGRCLLPTRRKAG